MNIPNRGKIVSIHFIFCHLQTIFAYRSQNCCWRADVPLLDQGYVHIRILIPLKGTKVSSTAISARQLSHHFWQLSGRNIIVQGTTVSRSEFCGNWIDTRKCLSFTLTTSQALKPAPPALVIVMPAPRAPWKECHL